MLRTINSERGENKMLKSKKINIYEAENLRYQKIQNLINLLQGNEAEIVSVYGNDPDLHFKLGRKITIDGENIKIRRKSFLSYEIKKVTINTEGSMAIYDHCGKKLCGSLSLNASLNNIELFCVWVHKNNIDAEVVSGKGERFFQYMILSFVVIVGVLLRIVKILFSH